MERVRRRFQQWRATRNGARSRIPQSLWASAVKMAQRYGVCRTATTLRLDYYSLKRRVESQPPAKRRSPTAAASSGAEASVAPGFLELPAPPWSGGECLVELEEPGGAKMRVHLKGFAPPDLAMLSQSFWKAVP
jgi:hypothetical protein